MARTGGCVIDTAGPFRAVITDMGTRRDPKPRIILTDLDGRFALDVDTIQEIAHFGIDLADIVSVNGKRV